MLPGVAEFVVQGITIDGDLFGHPEWAEQLCNLLGATGSGASLLFSYLRPVVAGGVKCLVVRESLEYVDERAFNTIKQYVLSTGCKLAGRRSRDAEAVETHPVIEQERRSPKNNGW